MKTEDLFEAFGDIDESFIISARKPVQKKDRTLFFLIPSFAAAVAVCAGVNHFTNIQPETPEYQIDSNLQSTVSEITEPIIFINFIIYSPYNADCQGSGQ